MARQTITFASLRAQCTAPTIAVASGGSLNAGSFYLSCVSMNRVGLNKPATPQQVTWSGNQQIQVTLPSSLRGGGEEIQRVLICASATSDPTTLQPLCWWRGITLQSISAGFYQEVAASLPVTIALAYPEQVVMGGVVADLSTLAAIAHPLDGMIRYVTSLGGQFYYDPTSTATVNGTTVLSAGASSGRWLPWLFPLTFGVGTITDVSGVRGCSRDVRSLIDGDVLFPPPAYAMDGSIGPSCTFWICNGTDETGVTLSSGARVSLEVSQNGLPKSQLFDKRIVTQMRGYVRLLDGTLGTTGLSTGQVDYAYGQGVYTLEQDLLSGYAVTLAISPRFKQEEIDGYLQASPLTVAPFFMPQAGTYLTGYRLWGDIIYPVGDRRRIYPRQGASVQVGSGSGIVQRFEFDLRAAAPLAIPVTNVSNAKITVNSNGDVFYRGTDANLATEVTRAIITMASGRSNPSTATAYTAVLVNGALSIQVTYPTAIRSDYPDSAIAGAGSAQGAQLNPPFAVLYIQRQSDGQIREFINNGVVPGTTQTFLVTSFTAGTVISALPNTTGNFGFWASTPAPTVTVQAAQGSFAADSYRVYWGFRYDGSTVSSVTHEPNNGCIIEMSQPINQLFSQVTALTNQIAGWNNGSLPISPSLLNLSGQQLIFNADAANTGSDFPYTLQAPAVSAAVALTLPTGVGTSGQVLKSLGNGQTQWAAGGGGLSAGVTVNYNASGLTVPLFTLLTGKYLLRAVVLITAAFAGSNPQLAIAPTSSYSYAVLLLAGAAVGTYFHVDITDLSSYNPPSVDTQVSAYLYNMSGSGQAIVFYEASS